MSLRNISDPWKTIMADGLLSELKKSISNADIFCNHPQKYAPNGHISKLLDEAITALKQKTGIICIIGARASGKTALIGSIMYDADIDIADAIPELDCSNVYKSKDIVNCRCTTTYCQGKDDMRAIAVENIFSSAYKELNIKERPTLYMIIMKNFLIDDIYTRNI